MPHTIPIGVDTSKLDLGPPSRFGSSSNATRTGEKLGVAAFAAPVSAPVAALGPSVAPTLCEIVREKASPAVASAPPASFCPGESSFDDSI